MHLSSLTKVACTMALILTTSETMSAVDTQSANTSVPEGEIRYRVSAFPDRVALIATASPAHSQTFSWRTRVMSEPALLQITTATPSPGLHLKATEHSAEHVSLTSANGKAQHHRVTVDGLTPDTCTLSCQRRRYLE